MNQIVVLIDFTSICEISIEHAALVAKKSSAQITLLHIADPRDKLREVDIKDELRSLGQLFDDEGIAFQVQVEYGNFFAIIPGILADLKTDLAIVGTHGIRGVQRNLHSENIVRLVNSLHVPTMVVQGQSEVPQTAFSNMLIPVLDEVYVMNNTDVLANFSEMFDSTLHILNFIYEDDEDGLSTGHIEVLKKQFEPFKRPLKYHQENTSVNVESYSRTISTFAKSNKCELIVWVVPTEAEDAKQFSDEDKMNMLLNRHGIPVLYSPR